MHRDSIEPRIASDISTISPKGGSISPNRYERVIGKASTDVSNLKSIVNDLVSRVNKLENAETSATTPQNDFKRNRILYGGTDGEATQSSSFIYEKQVLTVPNAEITSIGSNKEVRTNPSGQLEGYVDLDERAVCIVPFTSEDSVEVGYGTVAFTIPYFMNNYKLYDVIASVHTLGVTGQTSIQIRKRSGGVDSDMLLTNATIGNEYYAADEEVDPANNRIQTGDQLYIDVDEIHSGTAPNGLSVTMVFRR